MDNKESVCSLKRREVEVDQHFGIASEEGDETGRKRPRYDSPATIGNPGDQALRTSPTSSNDSNSLVGEVQEESSFDSDLDDCDSISDSSSDESEADGGVKIAPAATKQKWVLSASAEFETELERWTKIADGKLNVLRKQTNESVEALRNQLLTHKLSEDQQLQFQATVKDLQYARKMFDRQLKGVIWDVSDYPNDIVDARRGLGLMRHQILVKADRFHLAGLIQLAELEYSGETDFDRAVGTEESFREAREQLWEKIINSQRYEELMLATKDAAPDLDPASIPKLVAKAVILASRQESFKQAKCAYYEMAGGKYGRIFIDQTLYPEASVFFFALSVWMNVLARIGKFKDETGRVFLEEKSLMGNIEKVVEKTLFFPLRDQEFHTKVAETKDGLSSEFAKWHRYLYHDFNDMDSWFEYLRLLGNTSGTVLKQLRNEVKQCAEVADQEVSGTYLLYWPLYRASKLVEKRLEEKKKLVSMIVKMRGKSDLPAWAYLL